MAERTYIYGLVAGAQPKRFGCKGVGGAEVYAITHGNLAAVVSDTELDETDPTQRNVYAHTMVQDELLREYTLLPMAFGMVARTREEVIQLLRRNQAGLEAEMARLAGKVEVELKVFWDQQAMIRRLEGGHEELGRLKARIAAARNPVETQRLLVQAGQLVERISLDWKTRYAERVYLALKKMCVEARLNPPLGVKNILNASFLVQKAAEPDFQREVYSLDARYEGNVNFRYVGPLAPYNFVRVKLEAAN